MKRTEDTERTSKQVTISDGQIEDTRENEAQIRGHWNCRTDRRHTENLKARALSKNSPTDRRHKESQSSGIDTDGPIDIRGEEEAQSTVTIEDGKTDRRHRENLKAPSMSQTVQSFYSRYNRKPQSTDLCRRSN